jgi:hypothetical protein
MDTWPLGYQDRTSFIAAAIVSSSAWKCVAIASRGCRFSCVPDLMPKGVVDALEVVDWARFPGVDPVQVVHRGEQPLALTRAIEMSEHLGYDKHAVEGRNRGNSRNGKRSKTVLIDAAGAGEIDVPRDREGTFAWELLDGGDTTSSVWSSPPFPPSLGRPIRPLTPFQR